MRTFPFAHAGAPPDGPASSRSGWRDLARRCLDDLADAGRGPGLLYVTDPLAGDVADILALLRGETGVVRWSGAVAPAICAGGAEYFDVPAMAAMVLDLPGDAYATFPNEGADGRRAGADAPGFAIVHADPHASGVLDAVPALAESARAYLVGGLASAAVPSPLIADAPGGLSGVRFADRVPVATGLTQGCTPIGPAHVITSMHGDIVAELDGRPALDALKEDVGELLARDLRRIAGHVHAAIPVPGSDMADYLVRNLVGLDVEHGRVAVAAGLATGDRLMFVRRDPDGAAQDMRRMLDDLKRRAGARIRGAVYHSCVARGPHQFGPGAREMAMVGEALGDVPVIGFFGNGEISNDRLYTYTGVLSLFLDGDGPDGAG